MQSSFFSANRRALIEVTSGGVAVISAYGRQQRSNDAAYPFTQESNFWYLCGINEPDWKLVIDGSANRSYLLMPEVSDVHATFDGSLSADEAKHISGVDRVVGSDEAVTFMRQLAKKHPLVYTVGPPAHADHFNFTLNPSITRSYHELERQFARVEDITKDIAKLRAIKQPQEVAMIRRAIDITVDAFRAVHTEMKVYKNEYEIEADFTYKMRRSGADGHAYDPIIAAGGNACTLHYSRNQAKVASRQMVLMDVGASYGGYAADITRTYAKGEPTKRQREIHGAVEAAHKRIVGLIEPILAVDEYQRSVESIMGEAIESVGLGKGEEVIRRYFPHAISHGLGIDVHDSLGSPRHLQDGMVLTVEPGIYIPEEGIGVRIEDDILVTASGYENLSGGLSTGL